MRKSLKDKRDSIDFEREKDIQAFLHQQMAAGKLLIYYFDGSGFTTTPCVPYGWQKRGETRRLPTTQSKRLNILGFMSLGNNSFFHTVEGRVDSQAAIAAFDAFAVRYAEEFAQTKTPCVVILDNAPIHTSKAFIGKCDDGVMCITIRIGAIVFSSDRGGMLALLAGKDGHRAFLLIIAGVIFFID